MEANDLRTKGRKELRDELLGLLREQFNLRMQKATGQLSKNDRLRKVRRDIARIHTVLNEHPMVGDQA
ncbi:MAG: 50S ribosomal protein L29 [Chromatiales bacterium 21-64-14]|nr:MAG: 50S ribosomal protein L29 [Chromatiales bacterium 21-64-14]HQU15003.1 50S ribosomal protein L29 [Gammaproteobacteria bacterium]